MGKTKGQDKSHAKGHHHKILNVTSSAHLPCIPVTCLPCRVMEVLAQLPATCQLKADVSYSNLAPPTDCISSAILHVHCFVC